MLGGDMAKEWIKHVRHTHADYDGHAWCGRRLYWQTAFVDIDHAAYNAKNGGRLVICADCRREIVRSLETANGSNYKVRLDADEAAAT